MTAITVIKRRPDGTEIWRYSGRLLRREANSVVLEARFNRPALPFMGITLKENDRFVETYFTDRWYNIYAIHDRDDDRLKGWYCNVGRPAVWEAEDRLSYVDLALDLWVDAQGKQTVLDADEFAALDLDEGSRRQAGAALEELRIKFAEVGAPGFAATLPDG